MSAATPQRLLRAGGDVIAGLMAWAVYLFTRLLGRRLAMRLAGTPACSRAIAWMVNVVIRKKNHCFERNLRLVFPGIDDARIEAIRRQTFTNMAKIAVETFFLDAREVPGIAIHGREHLQGLEERGVIFVITHLNTLYYVPLVTRTLGFECALMHLPMPGPLLEALARHLFAPMGSTVPSNQTPRFVARIRDGRHVAIAADLRVKNSRNAVRLPFCGQPAWSSTFIAELAMTHGRAIVPVFVERDPDNRIGIVFEAPVDTSSGDRSVVQSLIHDSVSARILANPGAWSLWNTNRWGP